MANTIEKKLYGGKVEIVFYPDSHRYRLKGEKKYLIGVTSASGIVDKSRFLIPWAVGLAIGYTKKFLEEHGVKSVEEMFLVLNEAARQHEIKKEEAADIGSQVHDWVERFTTYKELGGEAPPITEDMDERVVNGINGFLDWYNASQVVYESMEQMVYSMKHGYVGTIDARAIVNGRRAILDYKNSKGVYSSMRYQVAAYWGADEEEHGQGIDLAIILRFDKETGAFEAVYIEKEELEKDYAAFLGCLAVKQREKELDAIWYAENRL